MPAVCCDICSPSDQRENKERMFAESLRKKYGDSGSSEHSDGGTSDDSQTNMDIHGDDDQWTSVSIKQMEADPILEP